MTRSDLRHCEHAGWSDALAARVRGGKSSQVRWELSLVYKHEAETQEALPRAAAPQPGARPPGTQDLSGAGQSETLDTRLPRRWKGSARGPRVSQPPPGPRKGRHQGPRARPGCTCSRHRGRCEAGRHTGEAPHTPPGWGPLTPAIAPAGDPPGPTAAPGAASAPARGQGPAGATDLTCAPSAGTCSGAGWSPGPACWCRQRPAPGLRGDGGSALPGTPRPGEQQWSSPGQGQPPPQEQWYSPKHPPPPQQRHSPGSKHPPPPAIVAQHPPHSSGTAQGQSTPPNKWHSPGIRNAPPNSGTAQRRETPGRRARGRWPYRGWCWRGTG